MNETLDRPRVYNDGRRILISVGNHEVAVYPHEVAHLIDQIIEHKRLVTP